MESEKLMSCFKALSDKTRMEIIEMLKGGTLCACKILEKFSLTQPTLSYHMKLLTDCGLVNVEKAWKWSYYSLNKDMLLQLRDFFDCVCLTKTGCDCN